MAATNVDFPQFEEQPYALNGTGTNKPPSIIGQPLDFVHYTPPTRTADEWAPDNLAPTPPPHSTLSRTDTPPPDSTNALKRKRGRPPKVIKDLTKDTDSAIVPSTSVKDHPFSESSALPPADIMEVEETLARVHSAKRLRTFDFVVFDQWKIKPWYFSPYPLIDIEPDELLTMATSRAQPNGVSTSTTTAQRTATKIHDHEKTSELLASSTGKSDNGDSLLWVCHFCFKYMADGIPWELHKKDCKMKSPPGKKVYQRGAHTIWEVDGAKEKLYCQNLSLFGKLFIDVKTLFFDCDNFLFYILTDAKSSEDHIIGFFSKEKVSYDDCNLACILTLPQYQRKGYGMLMIEFSYELSRREGKIGSPERPLSQLGLRGYLSYWISTLVRFFRRVLSTLSPEIATVRNRNAFPSLKEGEGDEIELIKDVKITKKKSTKGFDGEISEASVEAKLCTMPLKYIQGLKDPMFSSQRIFETKRQEDGSAITHVKIECTLADISRATYMKEQDIAFALNEIGLLSRRLKAQGSPQENGDADSETPDDSAQIRIEDTFVVTRSMIEQVAKERNVKIMILDRGCVLPY